MGDKKRVFLKSRLKLPTWSDLCPARQATREFDLDTNFIPSSIARDLNFNFVLNLERKGKRKKEFREICEISSELFEDLFLWVFLFILF